MTRGTHFRTCPLCEAMCGLEIETDGEQVVRVRGDHADVWSRGFLCPKGASIGQLHHDPDRLRAPMVRDGAEWREVTWDEAFQRCEDLLRPVIDEHGTDAALLLAMVHVLDDEGRRGPCARNGRGRHGQRGTRMSVANERPGVNTNVLVLGHFVDQPSGNAAVNGVPVEVALA